MSNKKRTWEDVAAISQQKSIIKFDVDFSLNKKVIETKFLQLENDLSRYKADGFRARVTYFNS